MFKKILSYLWSIRREFIRYFIIGTSSLILDLSSLYFFESVFHFSPVKSVVLNQIFILAYIFLMNKYWSFKSVGNTRKQMIRFLGVVVLNYVIAITWMWLFTNVIVVEIFDDSKLNHTLVRTVNVAFSMVWNFMLYKFWVYRVETAVLSSETSQSETAEISQK